MKTLLARTLCAVLLSLTLAFPALRAADAAPDAAGYWDGAITLPNATLEMRIEITRQGDRAWGATIDMPAQGMRGYKLEPVTVEGAAVTLVIPGVPGEPKLVGKVAADGKSLSGDFQQGGQSFPFKLERKPKPAPVAEKPPAPGIPGKGLVGYWIGKINPAPGVELQLALDVTKAGPDSGEAVLISLNQNNAQIPVSSLTEKDGAVRVEATRINANFAGKLNADGSEIAGTWEQVGRPTPLVFRRAAKP